MKTHRCPKCGLEALDWKIEMLAWVCHSCGFSITHMFLESLCVDTSAGRIGRLEKERDDALALAAERLKLMLEAQRHADKLVEERNEAQSKAAESGERWERLLKFLSANFRDDLIRHEGGAIADVVISILSRFAPETKPSPCDDCGHPGEAFYGALHALWLCRACAKKAAGMPTPEAEEVAQEAVARLAQPEPDLGVQAIGFMDRHPTVVRAAAVAVTVAAMIAGWVIMGMALSR